MAMLARRGLKRVGLSTSLSSYGIRLKSDLSKVATLPLPPLKHTMNRYIEYLEPLLSKDQMTETKNAVQLFSEEGGEGHTLQRELEMIRDETVSKNYVEGFWHSGYVEYRLPLPIHTSPFLLMREPSEDDVAPLEGPPRRRLPTDGFDSAISRASSIAFTACQFYKELKKPGGLQPPDIEKGQPLDMDQYYKMFGAVRVPGIGRDFLKVHSSSTHFILIHDDHYYSIECLDQSGEPHSESVIREAISHALSLAVSSPEDQLNIGALTSLPRDEWATARMLLRKTPENGAALAAVESALFVLPIDQDSPDTWESISRAMLLRPRNRWWDKLMFPTMKDGRWSQVLEHTPVDGHAHLRIATQMYNHLANMEDSAGVSATSSQTGSSLVRALRWVPSPEIHAAVEQAVTKSKLALGGLDLAIAPTPLVGGTSVKSIGFSPDAFVQCAIQLAYYRLYNRIESTYESVQTKKFKGGRTEVMRSVTLQSVAFTKTWLNPQATKHDKLESLRAAASAHVARAKQAKEGLGVDRHLGALYNVATAKERRLSHYEIPSIFTLPSFPRLTRSVISTSNVSLHAFRVFGFGPVLPEGIGIGYGIQNKDMVTCITSFSSQAHRYSEEFQKSLEEMMKAGQEAQ